MNHTESPWIADTTYPTTSALQSDARADVCIVGAGIAGLSVAYELTRAGRTVIVLDDGPIGGGETAHTTAHLSNAFDNRYYEVEGHHGIDASQLTAESHTAAIGEIERIVQTEKIDCEFERLDGYLFAASAEDDALLEKEYAACGRAGVPDVAWADRAPIGKFDTGRCLRFGRQAQMHPLRYLAGLVRAITSAQGRVFTATHATKIEGGARGSLARVETRPGGPVVTAQDVVVATNTPVNDVLTIHTKQYPYRTYVIAAPIEPGRVAKALYWDTADPYHYVRVHGDQLIVGGEDHKTGQDGGRIQDRHEALEQWARARFPGLGAVTHRWSGQVLEPMDGLAFIGKNPGSDDNLWIVTGDSGNGMTHGAIAGMLLRDLVLGLAHPWAKLYEPSRKPLSAAGTFLRENLNMAAQYRDWVTPGEFDDEKVIAPGTGAVLRDGLAKIAVYRDQDGFCHRRSAVCPHLGGIVGWNAEEGSWDCPAHGSRFDPYGKVLNGPANVDLGEVSPQKATRP